MHLPRGRFTDALIALTAFALIFAALTLGLGVASQSYGFIPAWLLAGGWAEDPLLAVFSPLASAFLPRDFLSAIFNGVFLLIAGRFVERAIGPLGLGVVFVAGAYGGALARLLLTPTSILASAGSTPSLFAIIGAYFMLYGVPQALPVPRHLPRVAQIGVLALVWLGLQLAFAIASGGIELSVNIIDPLGGLLAGIALARPMLAWQYRKA
jgi:membrane associated rhomboid family serine protease